ncbi:hypothetical protein KIH27_00530 [Mycobacterium sp. M1]|uniref:Uncharacterized protein n=1 Tax=Mycolicibacter acidiphilus TaxID=2835306 RepID=A0ABS5RCQ6_9MYCO|nr:hypothetical protein [Mycolicibacter acidiphilus]MBS9532067.1 hypothetical protein [Mycolicibacter acidiphilus]
MTKIDPAKIRAAVAARRRRAPLRAAALPPALPATTSMSLRADADRAVTASKLTGLRDRLALTVAELTAERFALAGNLTHEAAHAVVGTIYGGEVRTATANPARATEIGGEHFEAELNGVVAFAVQPTRPELMHLAGPVAHARFNAGGRRMPTGREVDRILEGSGGHDLDAITASGATVTNVFAEVNALVDRCWGSIVALAQRIHADGEVGHTTVLDVLGVPETGGEMALSLIRGGARPGTFTVTPAAV